MGDAKVNEPYSCGSCRDQIPTHRARVSCHSCANYHLCANCFVIKQYSKPHIESHSTMITKESGLAILLAPGFNPRLPPPLPPRSKPVEIEIEIPVANWGALWSIMKAPLEKRGKKVNSSAAVKDTTSSTISAKEDDTNTPLTPITSFPPSPPKSVRRNTEPEGGVAPLYSQPSTWQPLFAADSTPNANFVALMSTIFSHLDPEHTGHLAPEVYSGFLDIQGYRLEANIWKRAIEKKGREHLDVGDLELSIYFSDLGISHILTTRPKLYSQDDCPVEPKSPVVEKIRDSVKFSANMPMILRQGFIDLSAIEYLMDPSKAHEQLGRAVSICGIWKELGKMPRNVFPHSSIPRILQEDNDEDGENMQSSPQASDDVPPMKLKDAGGRGRTGVKGDEFVDIDLLKEAEMKAEESERIEQDIKSKREESKINVEETAVHDDKDADFGLGKLYSEG